MSWDPGAKAQSSPTHRGVQTSSWKSKGKLQHSLLAPPLSWDGKGGGTAEQEAARKPKGTTIQRKKIPEVKDKMWWRAQEEQANRRVGCNTSSKVMPLAAPRKEQGRTRLRIPSSGDGPAMPRRSGGQHWQGWRGHSSGHKAQDTGSPTFSTLKC